MRRYPAFDPPEYVNWKPGEEALKAFRSVLPREVPAEPLILRLYEGMLRNRLHDVALKRWVRQGVISKAWLGTGEEAVTVGNTLALRRGDVVGPMIRNAGACHEMGMPVAEMLKAYLGAENTITRGRDLHTGDPSLGVIPPTSFVASLIPVFVGIALSFQLKKESRVALTWVGDGARWAAEFHEGMSLAAARSVPLIVVLQDNMIALGTKGEVHSKAPCEQMAATYGVKGLLSYGNSVLDVHATTREAVELCLAGAGPVLITARTFRMGGHATHDEAEARSLFPQEVFDHWGKRDPIGVYETWMIKDRGIEAAVLDDIERRVTEEVEAAAEQALQSRRARPATEQEVLEGVHAGDGGAPATLVLQR